ncbi:disease resistance protein Pik-2-like [Panicum virgatum]|uniref:disease resistance protein Pik-2-like n=1 Tax=Panicum virgatum TaxID=38727 RepID=UPI0019D55D7C|nr:disease resistance protein Pik-2-like [Panicum virgatum]
MELATAALSSLLPKLGSLLVDAYNLQKGVRSDIRFLKDEMERMQAALSDLSKLPADHISDVDKLWARDLKELSYDIEDSIDAFTVRVQAGAQPPSLKGFRKFVHKIGLVKKITTRHRIAMDMSEIKSRINEVAERRARYNLPGVAGQPDATTIDPRLTALYEHVERLVGIDGPSEELISLLMKSSHGVRSQELMVVSIVGVGGLGKTTLANSVYERLKEKFDCHAFVSVSLKPDIKKVFGSLLRKLTRQEAGERDLDELISEINIFLRSRRYVLYSKY